MIWGYPYFRKHPYLTAHPRSQQRPRFLLDSNSRSGSRPRGLWSWRMGVVQRSPRGLRVVGRYQIYTMKTKHFDWFLVEPTHLKNISQIGSSPQVGVKIKNIWNHHPIWELQWIISINWRNLLKLHSHLILFILCVFILNQKVRVNATWMIRLNRFSTSGLQANNLSMKKLEVQRFLNGCQDFLKGHHSHCINSINSMNVYIAHFNMNVYNVQFPKYVLPQIPPFFLTHPPRSKWKSLPPNPDCLKLGLCYMKAADIWLVGHNPWGSTDSAEGKRR